MAKEKTKEQIAAEEAARESEKLVPITIRFTKGAMDVIDEVARKNKMSKAEVVRIACDNRLIEYLSQVIYVDEEQGDAVRKELYNIGESLSKIRLELNKIGVNYNQEVKLKNIKQKYAGKTDKKEADGYFTFFKTANSSDAFVWDSSTIMVAPGETVTTSSEQMSL